MSDHAKYMRQWRAARRKHVVKHAVEQPENRSDEALLALVRKRGRTLSDMMRTPFCMWRDEWLKETKE